MVRALEELKSTQNPKNDCQGGSGSQWSSVMSRKGDLVKAKQAFDECMQNSKSNREWACSNLKAAYDRAQANFDALKDKCPCFKKE